jgi:hypothetical protein
MRAEIIRLHREGKIPSLEEVLAAPRAKTREALGSLKRLLYCVNVNRTSLDHLLLGGGADVD